MRKLPYLRDHNHGIRALGDLDGIRTTLRALNLHVEESRTNLAMVQVRSYLNLHPRQETLAYFILCLFSLSLLPLFLSKFFTRSVVFWHIPHSKLNMTTSNSERGVLLRSIKHSARSHRSSRRKKCINTVIFNIE